MRVNGRTVAVTENMSLKYFLEKEGYDVQRVVVERNGAVVRRGTFGTVMLSDDDRLEIVGFVGGG